LPHFILSKAQLLQNLAFQILLLWYPRAKVLGFFDLLNSKQKKIARPEFSCFGFAFFTFPTGKVLEWGKKFDFGILMDSRVLRSPESKKVVFTKCLSVVCRANKNDSFGPI